MQKKFLRGKALKYSLNNQTSSHQTPPNTPSSARQGKGSKRPKKLNAFLKNKLKVFSIRSGIDLPFLLLTLCLLVIGLIMLFSASYPNAYHLHKGDSYYFIRSQMLWAILGVFAMVSLSYFDYNQFRKMAVPILVLSILLLVVVLFMKPTNGARRWVSLGFAGFQPSEVAKFAIILSFAHFISINFKRMSSFRYGVLPYVIILAVVCFLLFLEPHISCLLIIVMLAGGMLYIGGIKLRWFGLVLGVAVLGVLYLILFTDKLSHANHRIMGWLDPFTKNPGIDTWQTKQGLYAIGSGGLLGLGLGQSRQKYLYVAEPQNDFIFSVVCEELGFVGALIILLLFAMLIWRGIVISMRAKDRFGCLLGMGLTAQLGLQTILNILVVTNTVPNTGISLPFFSYGGTSLIMLLAEMGIVLSISRTSKLDKA